MLDERTEVNIGKGTALTTWNVVDDIMERDLPDPVAYFKNIGITGFDFSEKEVKDGSSKTIELTYTNLSSTCGLVIGKIS